MLIHYGRQTPAVQKAMLTESAAFFLVRQPNSRGFLAGGKAIGTRLLVRQNHCQEGITRI